MAHGQRTIHSMVASGPRETCLGVHEVVFLVDVEALVVVTTLVVVELIVDTIRLIAHMTILQISKYIPLLRDMVGSLQEHVAVEFMGIGVVILVIHIEITRRTIDLRMRHPDQMLLHVRMGSIGHIAEVVAVEVLKRQTSDDIPRLVLVVGVPHQTVGMLGQTLLTHKVRLLDLVAVSILHAQTKLRQFVVGTELLVVAIAIGIVQRGGSCPVVADVPGGREDIMVLPEVIRRLVPITAVAHLIALGRVCVGITNGLLFQRRDDQFLVERVILAQTLVPHIGIGLDARLLAIGTIHDTQVVGTSRHTIPGLARLLEVADVLVADLKTLSDPCQTTIITSASSAGAIDKAIGICLVVGTIEDPVVPQQTCRELATYIIGIIRAITTRHLDAGCLQGSGR